MKIYLVVKEQTIQDHGSPEDKFFRLLSTNDPYEHQTTNLLPFYVNKQKAEKERDKINGEFYDSAKVIEIEGTSSTHNSSPLSHMLQFPDVHQ